MLQSIWTGNIDRMGGHKRKLAAEQRERILQAQSIAGDRLNDDGSLVSSVCELLI